jgi:hypothetical protein
MRRRRSLEIGSTLWALLGAAIAITALGDVNADAKILVGVASVLFPLCALGAAFELRHQRDRFAGVLLLLSVATPTYFAYPLNLPALVIGLVLVTKRNFAGRADREMAAQTAVG